jgi:putative addiction module component (TIGR02574 family)
MFNIESSDCEKESAMKPQVLESLKALSVAERIQLVEDLWDSIALSQTDFALTEAQESELDRRLDALEKEQNRLLPWTEAATKILAGR